MINLIDKAVMSSLLRCIPEEMLGDLLKERILKASTYGKGQVIHFDGDKCNSLELVLEGVVVVERIDESGNLFAITEFYPNDTLGGNLLFSQKPFYPMTISARTNATLLEIPKNILYELCCNNKDFLMEFLKLISDNTILLGDKIKYFANRSIRDSITAFLNQQCQAQKSRKINLNMTKKALAERIGVQRTSLSRELQKMKKEGLIDFDSTTITILQSELLS